MITKLKEMKTKATETVKGFDYKKAIEDGKGRFGGAWDKSMESYESIKIRMTDNYVEDEAAYSEGFLKGAQAVLSDMEGGVAQGPSHYIIDAEKTLKGDYKAGYVAGIDSAFTDI